MNIYTFPLHCDVCGGEGMGTMKTAGELWIPGTSVRHTDPQVCADNLRRKKEELDKREQALNPKITEE